jgi:uncharacterized protein
MMSTQLIAGDVGLLEIAHDAVQQPRALAVICHPHPLHGGTMDNKVVTTIGRACASMDCAVLRLNYRGVGRSEGEYDATVGESQDAAVALAWLQSQYPGGAQLPVVLCGFSFGTAVAARLAARLRLTSPTVDIRAMVLAGAAVQRFTEQASDYAVDPASTLMVHGQLDDTVPLNETLAWAATLSVPVSVVPNADHFFNKQLLPLRDLTVRHLKALL